MTENKKIIIKLIDEINKNLRIKPISDSRDSNTDYTRVQVRRKSTLVRIVRYINDRYLIMYPNTKLEEKNDHAWVDIMSHNAELFVTYHL